MIYLKKAIVKSIKENSLPKEKLLIIVINIMISNKIEMNNIIFFIYNTPSTNYYLIFNFLLNKLSSDCCTTFKLPSSIIFSIRNAIQTSSIPS